MNNRHGRAERSLRLFCTYIEYEVQISLNERGKGCPPSLNLLTAAPFVLLAAAAGARIVEPHDHPAPVLVEERPRPLAARRELVGRPPGVEPARQRVEEVCRELEQAVELPFGQLAKAEALIGRDDVPRFPRPRAQHDQLADHVLRVGELAVMPRVGDELVQERLERQRGGALLAPRHKGIGSEHLLGQGARARLGERGLVEGEQPRRGEARVAVQLVGHREQAALELAQREADLPGTNERPQRRLDTLGIRLPLVRRELLDQGLDRQSDL